MSNYLRHPKTRNEMRANCDDCDGIIKIRPRRKPLALPNLWDDVPRGDWGHRSWKRHRKTQYKAA